MAILCSTLRALAERGARVHVASRGDWTMAAGALCSDPEFLNPPAPCAMPAAREAFATLAAARKFADSENALLRQFGAPETSVSGELAAAELARFWGQP